MSDVEKQTSLVVLSGGQDSTTCLFYAIAEGHDVHAITFNYGQKHSLELDAASAVFSRAMKDHPEQVKSHSFVSFPKGTLRSTSPLVDKDAILEQYADPASLPGGIEKTFVPMRNQLFLTVAANYAVALGATALFTGVCEEDYGGYPDCRRVFIDSLEKTINLSNEGAAKPIQIFTPLMYLNKAESVHMATELSKTGFNAYGALAFSHTAYDGKYPPLGKDHATLLREKGFAEANVPDPLIVRAWREGLMDLPSTANYLEGNLNQFLQYME